MRLSFSCCSSNKSQSLCTRQHLKQRPKMAHLSDARIALLATSSLVFVCGIIAFITPNWLASDRRLYGAEFVKLGLWETCFRSIRAPDDLEFRKHWVGCRWLWREEYQELRGYLLPSFFVATQVLYTIGFLLSLVSSIGLLALQICFITDREVFALKIHGFIMFVSALLCTIAVVTFGIRGDDRDWMPDPEHNFLSWSFGLAVVGSLFAWIASLLFWIESRILHNREEKREQQDYNMEQVHNIKSSAI